jgi:hypothetical protein
VKLRIDHAAVALAAADRAGGDHRLDNVHLPDPGADDLASAAFADLVGHPAGGEVRDQRPLGVTLGHHVRREGQRELLPDRLALL